MPISGQRAIAYGIAYLFVGILWLVPLILLAIALTSAVQSAVFVHNALRTDGTIVEVRCPSQSTRHGYQCLPVFRFTAADGQNYMVVSTTGGKFSDFAVGEPVKVLYLKDHPWTARIDSFTHLWAPSLIFALLGGVLAIFPMQVVRVRRRQRLRAAGLMQPS